MWNVILTKSTPCLENGENIINEKTFICYHDRRQENPILQII